MSTSIRAISDTDEDMHVVRIDMLWSAASPRFSSPYDRDTLDAAISCVTIDRLTDCKRGASALQWSPATNPRYGQTRLRIHGHSCSSSSRVRFQM